MDEVRGKRALIIGRGQVGSILAESLDNAIWWDGRIEEVTAEVLRDLHPDVVINAAGKTDLAWCENNAREAFAANVEVPVELFKRILALETKPRFIHFSSACIWDGPYDVDGKPFEPYAAPSPASYYAWTKAAADALMLSIDPDVVSILRPRQVFSTSGSSRNTLQKLLRYPGLIDTPNSMSSADVILRTVAHVMQANDWTGIWNVYDKDITTPYAIGLMLHNAGLRDEPKRIEKTELDQWHRPRRVDTVIHDARFEAAVQPEAVQAELRKAIEGLKIAHRVGG